MSLRGRITLLVSGCFLGLALLLVAEGQRRMAAAEDRLEDTQLLTLDVSWAGIAGAEGQRLLGVLERFRSSEGAATSFSTRDPEGLQRAAIAVRSDIRATHFQAVGPDGRPIYDTRETGGGEPILDPDQIGDVLSGTDPVSGLVPTDDGGLAYVLAAPVFARAGVAGAAILWSDIAGVLSDLSRSIGIPVAVLGAEGTIRATGGAPAEAVTKEIEQNPPSPGQVSLVRQDDRALRAVATTIDSALSAGPVTLVAIEDVSAELATQRRLGLVSLLALTTAMVLFFAFVNWSMRSSFRPLDAVIHSLNALSEGRTDLTVTVPERRDEIGRLAGTFETFRRGMQARARLDRLTQELEVAARIQSQCLPKTFPDEPGLAFAASMKPMREVGGDFYDVFALPDGRIGCVMADVSDKGVGAALFMAISRTVLRSTAMVTLDPAECVNRVNAYLCEENEAMLFVTLVYAVLDPATGEVAFCNAGHNPPAILAPGTGVELLFATPQPALGVWDEFDYTGERIRITPGSRLFLYTDGVTEAMTADGEEFGEERLVGTLKEVACRDAATLVAHVFDAVDAFAGDAPQSDDITCMGVVFRAGEARA